MALTKAIEFGSLVGAQLAALVEAEVQSAEKTTEFIETVGFERVTVDGEEKLVLQTVAFDMRRRDVDGTVRTHTVRVPVLSLVPIPLLSIEEASIEFELTVEEIQDVDEEEREEGGRRPSRRLPGRLFFGKKKRSKLKTRVARTTRTESTTKSDLKMTVRIAQSPFPLGIERLLSTADLSVEDETA